MTTPATVEAIAALRADPTLFVEEVLGATPQKWQAKALDAIAKHDRVAIKSGHGVGKTAFESWVVLWWLMTHYPCKVAVTANSAHQLSDVLWTEIDRCLNAIISRSERSTIWPTSASIKSISGTRSGVTLRAYTAVFWARTTPLRSKINPRTGDNACRRI